MLDTAIIYVILVHFMIQSGIGTTNLEYKLFDKYFIGLPPCNLAPFCQTGANSQVNSSGGWGSQVIAAVKLFFFVKYVFTNETMIGMRFSQRESISHNLWQIKDFLNNFHSCNEK